MLIPTCDPSEFEKFGFKKCKRPPIPGYVNKCYYLCLAIGPCMLFVSPYVYAINKWEPGDARIHKRPNCRYRDTRDALDITYELIKAGMLKADYEPTREK